MELPARLGIAELARAYSSGQVSPVEVVRHTLKRIARLDRDLNSYLCVTADRALEQARQAESEIRAGRRKSPLHGVPYAAKDLLDTRGIRTTVGSPILADNVPADDAAVIEKLSAAGAILLGKTGLHEWAYGITSSNPHFGPVRMPSGGATLGTPSASPEDPVAGRPLHWPPASAASRWARTPADRFGSPQHCAASPD